MLLGRGWRRAQDRKVCSCTDTLSLYAARSGTKLSGLGTGLLAKDRRAAKVCQEAYLRSGHLGRHARKARNVK